MCYDRIDFDNIRKLIPIYEPVLTYYYTHPSVKVNKELLIPTSILAFAQFSARFFIQYAS